MVNSDLDISFDDDDDIELDIDTPVPASTSDKRQQLRIRLGRIWLGYEGRHLPVKDISRNGMFVLTKIAELPPSRIFGFKIIAELNDTKISVPAKAQVVRYEKFKGYAIRYQTSVEVWNNLFRKGRRLK